MKKKFYDTMQKDMKSMIEFYQQHVELLEELKPTTNSDKKIKKETEMEMLGAITYRTEYFVYQLKSKVEKMSRPI